MEIEKGELINLIQDLLVISLYLMVETNETELANKYSHQLLNLLGTDLVLEVLKHGHND